MSNEANPSVVMREVTKIYPSFTLQQVSFSLPQGNILGLVGPNGAGKSTLLKLMLGFIQADGGDIHLLGQDMRGAEVALKQQVAYVSEDMRLYGGQSIDWHMRFLSKCFSTWDSQYAKHLLQRFDLNSSQLIKQLSLGQRIKATLLMALARRPKLLVLDEPSTGLDPIARYELTSELLELMLDAGNSVVFSSQLTQDVEQLSDVIAFIDRGELISYQDKEQYLDQWRRLNVTVSADAVLPDHWHCLSRHGNRACVIDHFYSEQNLAHMKKQEIEVQNVQALTLEEIFIHQVLLRRKEAH